MRRLSTYVAAAAVLTLALPAAPAFAQRATIPVPRAETLLAKAAQQGVIQGVVLGADGRPLPGAMVSALGSTVAFALTGRDGRFALDALPLGVYTVRVHLDGFLPSRRQVVDVRGGAPSIVSVALQTLSDAPAGPERAILVAGLSPFDVAPVSAKGGVIDPAKAPDEANHDHSETAWRLRHLKRSVLKTVDDQIAATPEPATDPEGAGFGRAFDSTVRAATVSADSLFSGQVNLLATGAFGAETAGPSVADSFATGGIAYVALGAPVGTWGAWDVRGAMRQGQVGSWFLAGAFTGRVAGTHSYSGGLSYGTQRLGKDSLFGPAALQGGSRSVATVYAFDDWALSRRLAISYGLAYAWQDYVASGGLLSPRLAATFSASKNVRVRAIVSRTTTAPGAEELLPATLAADGLLLPAERSFSSWTGPDGFRAQRTDHFELAVERAAKDFILAFRSFYQRVDDQMGVVFAHPTLDRPAASLGHYYVTTAGDLSARGWAVSVSRPIVAGLRGSVDYAQTTTRWQAAGDGVVFARGMSRPGGERFHDLTTSLETDIPLTATRVYVLYRINTAGVAESADADTVGGMDARFDVQVNQALPFMEFTSADWEVLLAVRNLFRDQNVEQSVLDELLVVRPPTRVVGGVRIRF